MPNLREEINFFIVLYMKFTELHWPSNDVLTKHTPCLGREIFLPKIHSFYFRKTRSKIITNSTEIQLFPEALSLIVKVGVGKISRRE